MRVTSGNGRVCIGQLSTDSKLVLTLLERGADIGAVNIDGWTAFHWAAFNGHENIVTLLIEKGAQILAVTGGGWTAAELADSNGHKDVTLRIRSKDLLASLFAIFGADTELDSVIPVLRFFIACPRSGSTCLMRIFNENELCRITSCLIQMRYKEQEYQPDYTVLQTPTHNRIYNMAKRKKKHFLVSKEELSNGHKTYPYDVLPNDKAYEITKPAVLFRDPVRIFDSWKRLGWANFDVFVKTYKKLYEISDGEKAFRVIYENMLSDPAKEIGDLCLWWEIPFQETMLEFKQPFRTFLENLLPRTITFAGGVIAIGGSNSYYGGYPNTSSGYSGYPKAGPQSEALRLFEGLEGSPGVDSHYYAWEDPEVKAESAYPNTFSPFSTLQATDTIVSKIQSHRSLNNDEILRVEDEVGLLYIKSLGSRVSGLRNALLARNWYGFNLDETLHEFNRMVDGATTLLTPMNQGYDLPRWKLESGSSFRDHVSYAITDPERGQQISEFFRSNFKTEQHPNAEVSDRLAKHYPQFLGPSLEIKCGVLSLFDSLKRMGKKIAIFTTGSRHLRMWMLQELGLWDLVDRLETSNSRNGFNCLFKDAFEYFSDNAIYIGSSLDDISAVQEQGVYCIHYSEAENISLQSTPPRIKSRPYPRSVVGSKQAAATGIIYI